MDLDKLAVIIIGLFVSFCMIYIESILKRTDVSVEVRVGIRNVLSTLNAFVLIIFILLVLFN